MSVTVFFEKTAAFACGALLAAAITWLVKSKPKYVRRILLNSLSGGLLQLVLTVFSPIKTTTFSWFVCGVLGIIGFAVSLFN
jgi:hypothetical protein